MARVMVTGGLGTLGRWVVREMARQQHDVTLFVRDSAANRRAVRSLPHARVVWGDLRDAATVVDAVREQDCVVHLAAIVPPLSERETQASHAVNVGGTADLIAACLQQPKRPRFVFTSSVEVFGKTRHLGGVRTIDDPVSATSAYAAQKIEAEQLVRESGLDALILRLGAVIDITLESSHELMFQFPVDARFEAVHVADAALAVTNAVTSDARGLLLVAGGPSCQSTYGEFVDGMLETLGVGALPHDAFSRDDYPCAWMDTAESQRVLKYQRHSVADIRAEIQALLGWRKVLLPLVRPFVRRSLLRAADRGQ